MDPFRNLLSNPSHSLVRNRNLTNGKLVTWFLVFYSVLRVGQKGRVAGIGAHVREGWAPPELSLSICITCDSADDHFHGCGPKPTNYYSVNAMGVLLFPIGHPNNALHEFAACSRGSINTSMFFQFSIHFISNAIEFLS